MKLEECRRQIDELDAKLVALLNRRAILAREIGRIKLQAGLPVSDPEREEKVLRGIMKNSSGPVDDRALARLYREILTESRRIQNDLAAELLAGGEISR
ncbi:MAG TPA: chorismate mutase [Pyrinomonadaceae bacterium]|nr:chorismate mutase [Pyrinomonadaceae bacterium]